MADTRAKKARAAVRAMERAAKALKDYQLARQAAGEQCLPGDTPRKLAADLREFAGWLDGIYPEQAPKEI